MPSKRRDSGFRAVLAAFLLAVSFGAPAAERSANAAVGPWAEQEQVRLRLVAAGQAVGEVETISLGLQFRLEPGWKIYWRSPGEAGYPPSVDWNGSENLAEAELEWPVPHRFSLFGMETFGYSDEVVLPIDVRLQRPGEAVRLRANVDYLTCKELCIPRQAELSLDLPAGPNAPSPDGFLIDSYRALVPGDGSTVGLNLERAVLTGSVAEPVLQVTVRSDIAFVAPDVLVETPPGFLFGKPEVSLEQGGRKAVLRLATLAATEEGVLEGKRLTLTVIDGARGLEQTVIARFAAPATGAGASLPVILALALLGGLILNLMPCVLPVLSIKLLSVVDQGGSRRREVRTSFLASAAGVLASILVLATAAVALKALGMTVGWGIQFQQPLFLAAMVVVVGLFAYNLFGLFEISLPGWAQDLGLIGTAGGTGPRVQGLRAHFLTGAFATLLATPCSAPFLGTAVGFALARGPAEIYLIFTVLGLGLALPYLAIAAVPALVARLPRPGPWMIALRRVLGLVLAGTATWLLSVLAAQVGLGPPLGIGALLVALGLFLWLGRLKPKRRFAIPALAALLALAALGLSTALATRNDTVAGIDAGTEARWRPLDLRRIHELVSEGKVVFVDVTAEWCITCQINKRLVIDGRRVSERLNGEDVITMRGDWTLPNEEISRYLERFGRYGIPFDAVYGPGAPDGLALPELLTVGVVIEALEKAAGGPP